MPDLVLKPNGWQGRVVRLTDQPVTIGRHPDNTIRIKDDRASRFHCVIEDDGHGRHVVRDLESRNGTKVNSIRIDRVFLEEGDLLRIGTHEFVIHEVQQKESPKARGKSSSSNAKKKPAWEKDLEELLDTLPPHGEVEAAVEIVPAIASLSGRWVGENPGAALGLLEAVMVHAEFAGTACVGPDDVFHLVSHSQPWFSNKQKEPKHE